MWSPMQPGRAFGYRPCCCPGGSSGSPQCARPMGCWSFPVPLPPYLCTCVRCPGPLGSCSPLCPHGVLSCLCGVLGHLAPVHRCARSVCCFVCAVSWATWPLFTGVPASFVLLRVRCPGPLGSCSLVCPLGALLSLCSLLGHLASVHRCLCGLLCCMCRVLGHLAPVHRCARAARCFACAVSCATWLLFTSVLARCVVLRARCPEPIGSCSPVCSLGALLFMCAVLGHFAPVHQCARSVPCFACVVSWATWLLFTGVPAGCVVFRVRCPGPLGICSAVCPLGLLCCVCDVLSHLAPVHWCARSVCCVACVVSSATWLLFTGVPAGCVVLLVRCPGPLASCSPLCPLGALVCVCIFLGHLAPAHCCARLVCCVACAVSWTTWLLFTGMPARCFACVCGVLGHLAPVHRCARLVRSFACAVCWATWLLFTSVPAWCVVLRVRCPGPLGSCSPVCPLGALLRVCGVLGHLVSVHWCARRVCCVPFAVSWATWLLFTGVPAWFVVLCVRCLEPLGSCSLVCPLGVLCCVCGLLGHLAPVHRCARSVRCFACAVSWATWILFTSVPPRCFVLLVRSPWPLGSCSLLCPVGALFCLCGVLDYLASVYRCARSVLCLCVRCPGPLGSCSPVCPLGALFCLCGVLDYLASVYRCARSVLRLCVQCPGPFWLLFIGVPALCVVSLVRCPEPLGSCSPVCPLVVLYCVCSVLGHLAPVHRCACWVCCFACAVSGATWLLFTGVPTRCVALRVRCPGQLGSCPPVCPDGVLFCLCGGLGHLAPTHCCARLVRCFACAVSWTTWLLFTGRPARCFACVCGVLGHLAPVHRSACFVRCFACAVSWATWLLFTGLPAWCVVLCVRCPGPLRSCSAVCLLGALLCVCCVLGHLAPVHWCARSVCCVQCAVSLATWHLFTGVPAWFVVLRVWCPEPLGSCSPVCPLGALLRVCGVLGHLASVHRCARSVRCFACVLSLATWLLFTGVPAGCVVLLVRCPGPLASCSPVCPLRAMLCVCIFLGHLAPVHRRARTLCCFACAVSLATCLLLTALPAWCIVLLVRCPWPRGSCSPVCLLGALFCLWGVLGNLAPVHRCARLVRCFAFAVSPDHLAPVHQCARTVCCVACAVSWAPWLLFTGALARCAVPCPWPLGFCSLLCSLGVLCCRLRLRDVAAGRSVVHPDGGC